MSENLLEDLITNDFPIIFFDFSKAFINLINLNSYDFSSFVGCIKIVLPKSASPLLRIYQYLSIFTCLNQL